MKELLKTLSAAYGASGHEDAVRECIRTLVAPLADELRTDAMGNLIAIRRGEGPKLMVLAHMDQIGFIVTDIEENGFLRVHNLGGINRNTSLNRHVVFENGLNGVLSFETKDFKAEDDSMLPLYVDIGAGSRAAAEALVAVGDTAVFAPDFFEGANGLLCSPAMDDRTGCAVLIEALRRLQGTPKRALYAVFTVQEELGLRGARTAAYAIEPDMAVALDVTPAGDTPKSYRSAVKLGGGPCVKIMDYGMVCSPAVVREIEAAADRSGVPLQREVLTRGTTDGRAVQVSRGGVPTGVISIPCRYVHSAAESVALADLEAAAELLRSVMEG